MLKVLSRLTRISRGACSLLFDIIKEDSSKLVMARKESNARKLHDSGNGQEKGDGKRVSDVVDDVIDDRENFHIYQKLSAQKLHLNLEELPADMQATFIELYLEELTKDVKKLDLVELNFNFLNEEVFRYHLNMPIRKLGFKSYFMRYNNDKGLAVFEKRR